MLSGQPRIRASVLAGYGEFLSRRSIGLEELLNKAGLPPSVLANPDAGFPLNSVALLMELAAEAAGDASLALRYAEAMRRGASGVLGYLVSDARTVREASQALEHDVGTAGAADSARLLIAWPLPASAGRARRNRAGRG
jgi:hypothetical protein